VNIVGFPDSLITARASFIIYMMRGFMMAFSAVGAELGTYTAYLSKNNLL
jgi:hypothetical protein